MIVSSYSPSYQSYSKNTSFGSPVRTDKISSKLSTATKNVTAKKAFSLGAILTGLFGLSKTVKNEETVAPKQTQQKEKYRVEHIYDKNGKLIQTLKYSNADDVLALSETYDKETGKVAQKDYYRKNGETKQYSQYFDKDGDLKKAIGYSDSGSNIAWREDYNKTSPYPMEASWFDQDGKITDQVKCDNETGDVETRFCFDKKGNLTCMSDVAGLTGKNSRTTHFHEDGSKTVEEFNIVSGLKTGNFEYDKSGNLTNFNINPDACTNATQYFKNNTTETKNDFGEKVQNPISPNLSKFLIQRFQTEHAE